MTLSVKRRLPIKTCWTAINALYNWILHGHVIGTRTAGYLSSLCSILYFTDWRVDWQKDESQAFDLLFKKQKSFIAFHIGADDANLFCFPDCRSVAFVWSWFNTKEEVEEDKERNLVGWKFFMNHSLHCFANEPARAQVYWRLTFRRWIGAVFLITRARISKSISN